MLGYIRLSRCVFAFPPCGFYSNLMLLKCCIVMFRLALVSLLFSEVGSVHAFAETELPSEAQVVISKSLRVTDDLRSQARKKLETIRSRLSSRGDLDASISVQEKIQATYPKDPIVGRWRWFNGGFVDLLPDGRVFDVQTKTDTVRWYKMDLIDSKYRIKWRPSKWVDSLWLSDDGSSLRGQNQAGVWVGGTKAGELPNKDGLSPQPDSMHLLAEAADVVEKLNLEIEGHIVKTRATLEQLKKEATKSNNPEGALSVSRAMRALK